MIERFIKWLISQASPTEHKQNSSPFDDKEFRVIIAEKKRHLERAEKIVGKSPMEQIDYTIEHGLEKFNEAFFKESYERQPEKDYGKRTPRPVLSSAKIDSVKIDSQGLHVLSIHHTARSKLLLTTSPPKPSVICEFYTITAKGGVGNKTIISETVFYQGTKEDKIGMQIHGE